MYNRRIEQGIRCSHRAFHHLLPSCSVILSRLIELLSFGDRNVVRKLYRNLLWKSVITIKLLFFLEIGTIRRRRRRREWMHCSTVTITMKNTMKTECYKRMNNEHDILAIALQKQLHTWRYTYDIQWFWPVLTSIFSGQISKSKIQ